VPWLATTVPHTFTAPGTRWTELSVRAPAPAKSFSPHRPDCRTVSDERHLQSSRRRVRVLPAELAGWPADRLGETPHHWPYSASQILALSEALLLTQRSLRTNPPDLPLPSRNTGEYRSLGSTALTLVFELGRRLARSLPPSRGRETLAGSERKCAAPCDVPCAERDDQIPESGR